VNDPTVQGAIKAALQQINAGRDHAALPILDSALARVPRDPALLQTKGLALRNLGDLAPALEILKRARSIAPRDQLIAHTLARAAMEAGLPASALYEDALKLAPGNPDMVLGSVAALMAEGQAQRAEERLRDASFGQPGWSQAHRESMRLRLMLGQSLESASEGFARAVSARPAEPALWHGWISALMEGRRAEEADAVLARARAALPGQPLWAALEPMIAAMRGDADRADRGFAAMGRLDRTDLLLGFVRHLFRQGRHAQALGEALRGLPLPGGRHLWPYVALGWRLTDDPRWRWLESDERLVSVIDLPLDEGFLAALADRLRALHLTVAEPPEQSVRRGTQTDGPLFSRLEPEIRQLKAAVTQAVRQHVAQLPPADPRHPTLAMRRDQPVRYAGAWSVRLTGEGYHADHVHSAGWLSSAFYVQTPDTLDAGTQAGWLSLGEVRDLVADLPPFRLVEPRPGRLVIFPSVMWHGTRPFAAGERLSVAFDVAAPPA